MGSIDDALAGLPSPAREALAHVVDVARRVVPEAEDGVSYGVPALRVDGKPLVGVQAATRHLAVIPFSPGAVDAVRGDLDGWSVSKGMVRFTADRPVPDAVLERLVRARLAEIRPTG
ncbi:iron chaperone [Actinotalea solisilvae]|uniref:iron chaperone n=1 Tax=Actinotalea solisilvae TaxID=2072922 RepID=UPI0018F1AE93|nr:DUF1801 domain-containing protein [Actinotalea solisilvae]